MDDVQAARPGILSPTTFAELYYTVTNRHVGAAWEGPPREGMPPALMQFLGNGPAPESPESEVQSYMKGVIANLPIDATEAITRTVALVGKSSQPSVFTRKPDIVEYLKGRPGLPVANLVAIATASVFDKDAFKTTIREVLL